MTGHPLAKEARQLLADYPPPGGLENMEYVREGSIEWMHRARPMIAQVVELREALAELSGYVRSHLAGNDADPELKWALDLAVAVLSAAGTEAEAK